MLFGGYIIPSLSSLIAVTHYQTRIPSNSHTVNTELPKCSKK